MLRFQTAGSTQQWPMTPETRSSLKVPCKRQLGAHHRAVSQDHEVDIEYRGSPKSRMPEVATAEPRHGLGMQPDWPQPLSPVTGKSGLNPLESSTYTQSLQPFSVLVSSSFPDPSTPAVKYSMIPSWIQEQRAGTQPASPEGARTQNSNAGDPNWNCAEW